jgi:dTDP-4-dehydrorhamnose reductase
MKKVIIFGASGMAGHMVYDYLQETGKYDIVTVCNKNKLNDKSLIINVQDYIQLNAFAHHQNSEADVVINCVGLLVKNSNEDNPKAIMINSFFPKFLEKIYSDRKTKVIHLSTDCIFDGLRGRSYTEKDKPTETNFYGRSKALGEINNNKDLTFRMSIIGPELYNGTGLFHWFMTQETKVNGFVNLLWNGVTTLELARAIDAAIDQNLTGLYHLTNNVVISKYILLKLIAKAFNKTTVIEEAFSPNGCDKSIINTRTDFDFVVKSFDNMLIDLKAWMDAHPKYPY